MNLTLRTILTPSCWVRGYRTNKIVDRFVTMIIDNQKEVTRVSYDNYYIYIEFRGKIYGFWASNGWFGYLSKIILVDDITKPYVRKNEFDGEMPSRKTCFRFYNIFGKAVEKHKKETKTQFMEEALEVKKDDCPEVKEVEND